MTALIILISVLVILSFVVGIFFLMRFLKNRQGNIEFTPQQKSLINFVLKLHSIERKDRELFIDIIDVNLKKRIDRLEHIVISRNVFKNSFANLKKKKDIKFINLIDKKLFPRKKGL
ncbi:hypothetical protein KAJ27_01490 [bacterium]|nr:hypothetical protein [bacterium]